MRKILPEERTEPPDKLEWVDDFMRDIQDRYLFFDKHGDREYEIIFIEGFYSSITENGDYDPIEEYQEVCLKDSEGLQTINNDHVYYASDYRMAAKYTKYLRKTLLGWRRWLLWWKYRDAVRILWFRHPDSDRGTACTIEPYVLVNRLGCGIFVRKDLVT